MGTVYAFSVVTVGDVCEGGHGGGGREGTVKITTKSPLYVELGTLPLNHKPPSQYS